VELGALGLAALCLGAIVVILIVYHNSKLPSWSFGTTLNSILSILSHISTVGLVTALVGALSQQKWLRFRKSPKPLKDLAEFDEASRGLWGSFLLLCSKSKFTYVAGPKSS
jgi:hypothetical protein